MSSAPIEIDSSLGKRKVAVGPDGDIMEIIPLGAGQEVGRSCVLLKFKNRTVMLDCGIHPGKQGLQSLPFFDVIEDASEIDVLLVTHFHLDHCASLPYFMEKTNFQGRVFMTHPTKAIYKLILSDFVKVTSLHVEDALFTADDLEATMDRIETINFHQDSEVNGIKFWCYNAGHVLGAAMFMLDIDGVRILYTGDYSREEDRHLMAAEVPSLPPDVLIVESTYGKQIHEPRLDRESRFTGTVYDIVKNRRGRCLVPVFALGRAQELLLILDEYWEAHPELHGIPIYYASALAHRCLAVYRTYINMMNDRIKQAIAVTNPFEFKHIINMHSVDQLDDSGPCVVMASPGMLQSGISRRLFERWCGDRRNGLIIPGYVVEGTLAKQVISEPQEIVTESGLSVPLRMTVGYISFSAHSDFAQTSEFIDILQPPHVVLVHGEATEMGRLKGALVSKYKDQSLDVYSPKNCQPVALTFRGEKSAKTVGQLAANPPQAGQTVSGLLVRRNFTHQIMLPGDLHTYTQLATSNVKQKLRIPFYQPFLVAVQALARVFAQVELTTTHQLREQTFAQMAKEGAGADEVDRLKSEPEAKAQAQQEEEAKAAAAAGTYNNHNNNNNDDDDDDDADNEMKNNDDETELKTTNSSGAKTARQAVRLQESVVVIHDSDAELVMEWQSNPVTDMVADAVSATLMQLQTAATDPAALVKHQLTDGGGDDDVDRVQKRARAIHRLLSNFFADVRLHQDQPHPLITVGDSARIQLQSQQQHPSTATATTAITTTTITTTTLVECADKILKSKIEDFLTKINSALN